MLNVPRTGAGKSKKSRESRANEKLDLPHSTALALGASPLNADVVEFETWLEALLDGYGADGSLYARCVLSILKATSTVETEHPYMTASADLLERTGLLKNVSGCRDAVLSFPANSIGHGGGMTINACASQTVNEDNLSNDEHETRRLALIDCLKTVEKDEERLQELANSIFAKYTTAMNLDKDIGPVCQNESIDSGVCPSPVESEQNYDEAFPRLFDVDEDVNIFPVQPVGVPFDQVVNRSQGTTVQRLRKASSDEDDFNTPIIERPRATKQTAPIPIPSNSIVHRRTHEDVTPVSAFKSTSTDPLNHHDDVRQQLSQTMPMVSSLLGSCAELIADCSSSCERANSNFATSHSSFTRIGVSRASTVSCKLSSRSVHVHSIAANSLRSSSIGNKLVAPFTREWATRSAEFVQQHSPMSSVSCPNNVDTVVPIVQTLKAHPLQMAMLIAAQQANAPQFVVAKAPNTLGGAKLADLTKLEYCYCQASTSKRTYHLHHHSTRVSPAQKLALEKLSHSLDVKYEQQQVHRFILPLIYEQKSAFEDGRSGSLITHKDQHPPVYFNIPQPVDAQPGFGYDPWMALQYTDNLGVNIPTSSNADIEEYFCIPNIKELDGETNEAYADPEEGGVKIPVSPTTHFVPIRSESMENAYLPIEEYTDANDVSQYAIEYYGAETYFVLRAELEPTVADDGEATPSRVRRSLPIKFKAILPEKQCQTEIGCQTATLKHYSTEPAMRLYNLEERNEHCDELVDPWTSSHQSLKRKHSHHLPQSSSWAGMERREEPGDIRAAHSPLKDGDNTVALPDAWANSVWEPRLSLASTSTYCQSPVPADPPPPMADDSGIGDVFDCVHTALVERNVDPVPEIHDAETDTDDEEAFLSWMMRKATSQLGIDGSSGGNSGGGGGGKSDTWFFDDFEPPSRRRSDAVLSRVKAAEAAAAVRRVHSDDEPPAAASKAPLNDDDDVDALLRYVSNINLLQPLNSADDRTAPTTNTSSLTFPMILQHHTMSTAETTSTSTSSTALTVV